MKHELTAGFDFEVDARERGALLAEARKVVAAKDALLGENDREGTRGGGPSAAERAALSLIDQFDQAVAQFSQFPDVIHLEEKHFAEHGLPVPQRFRDLSDKYRFYWIRFPAVFKPAAGTAFTKLQCAVHFNPDTAEPHLLPRAALILPDRKFQEILRGNLDLDVRINEKFEFEASSGGVASVDAKAAAGGGLVAGPFRYSWKRALVDHTAPGAEKVFWTLADSRFSETDELAFIVVLQVPKPVSALQIAGALRAYHGFDLTADLGDLLNYFGKRLLAFWKAGAPTTAPPAVWNISLA